MSASETSKEDRQLPATERRLQQAREEGQLARSRDLVHLAAVLALLALFVSLGPWLSQQALQLIAAGLRFDPAQAEGAPRCVSNQVSAELGGQERHFVRLLLREADIDSKLPGRPASLLHLRLVANDQRVAVAH